MESTSKPRRFAVIFVLGAPGAGKGTLCIHLAQMYNLTHFSVGDGLRDWMRKNSTTPLAVQIQDKLDNQGFLTSEDLNPFIRQAIFDALQNVESGPQVSMNGGEVRADAKPDVVLSFNARKENAQARYLGRARDSNDSRDKFERRFGEFEVESVPVAEAYRKRGLLIDIDANGTKEENIKELTAKLEERKLWQRTIVGGSEGAHLLARR